MLEFTMQNYLLKYSLGFLLLISQTIESQGQSIISKKADSLFNAKVYDKSANFYRDLLAKHDINRSNAFLKLAFISENEGDFVKAIYYLNEYYMLHPTDRVFDKINLIANENNFTGYDRTDINFLLIMYRQYFFWIIGILLTVGIYVYVVLWTKRQRYEPIKRIQKYTLLFFLGGLLFMINITDKYKVGIVKNNEAFIRTGPSNASQPSGRITAGNKLNVVGQNDIWYRIIYQNNLAYIKADDIWVISQ